MPRDLSTFEKKNDYLICIDSDGCVMNTMDIKHLRCFGPCLVKEWGLEQWEDEILTRWNEINLYSNTRGINRFRGLSLALTEIDETYCDIEDLPALNYWVENSKELSNDSLKRAIEAYPEHVALQKALSWSTNVNKAIVQLPDNKKRPFDNAKESIEYAHGKADVAIVSSANLGAVIEEWQHFNLLEDVDVLLAQNSGTKPFCIGELLKKGYEPDHVLVCGDAMGDYNAAQKNGVLFYPIIVKKEKESWSEFISTAFDNFISGTFKGTYQEEKINSFLEIMDE